MEGLGRRHTLVGSLPQWLVFDDERRRAALADSIFAAPTVEEGIRRARADGVGLLFLERGGDAFGLPFDRLLVDWRGRAIFSDADVIVLKVGPA